MSEMSKKRATWSMDDIIKTVQIACDWHDRYLVKKRQRKTAEFYGDVGALVGHTGEQTERLFKNLMTEYQRAKQLFQITGTATEAPTMRGSEELFAFVESYVVLYSSQGGSAPPSMIVIENCTPYPMSLTPPGSAARTSSTGTTASLSQPSLAPEMRTGDVSPFNTSEDSVESVDDIVVEDEKTGSVDASEDSEFVEPPTSPRRRSNTSKSKVLYGKQNAWNAKCHKKLATAANHVSVSSAQQQSADDRDDRMFGKMLSLELRKLTSPALKRKVKRKLLDVVYSAQDEQEQQQLSNTQSHVMNWLAGSDAVSDLHMSTE